MIQESPFSLYVTLRKKFTSYPSSLSQTQNKESNSLPFSESDVSSPSPCANLEDKKEKELANAYNIIQQLEKKLECCEADLFKESKIFKQSKDVLNDEIKMLKDSIKKRNVEHEHLKENFSESNKQIQLTEKDNNNLQRRIDNFTETTKNLKENIKKLKKEKVAAEKTSKLSEKKMKAREEKFEGKIDNLQLRLLEKPAQASNHF